MENTNQDAMMHQQPTTYQSDTGGPLQIPDQTRMMGDDATDDLTQLVSNDASTEESDTHMATSDGAHDAAASVGNNDGNLPDPETIELEDLTIYEPSDDNEELTRLD